MRQGLCNGTVSVCLSVPARKAAVARAAGLLLWDRRAGGIVRLLHSRC